MDNRYTIIKDLVLQAVKRLREDGISVDDNDISNMINDYNSSNMSIEQVKQSISNHERLSLVRNSVLETLKLPMESVHDLGRLSVQYKGITIHNQDIDLMLIANSNSFEELKEVLNKVSNIDIIENFENEDFFDYRQRVFDAYLNTLSERNDSILNPSLELAKKIEFLSRSGVVNDEEMISINRIIADNKFKGIDAIMDEFMHQFSKEKVHEILLTIKNYIPIEKEGIKNTSIDFYRRLFEQIKYGYDSLTLDEEAKYGKVILQDGTFDDRNLRKGLEFARNMGKTMRINTLFFYMDCPEDIYNLEEGYVATALAKEKLTYYVSEISSVLSEYSDVVRSVDVFNELLNRHPLSSDIPYLLRGDISQENADDNIKAGWLKHLTVEDVCDVLVVAREKIPNMDFMYNDDYLTDSNKIPATIELIKRIQDYSKGLGVNLIDSIGTQMHIDNDVSKDEIRQMFISLSELGLPIEITEFDLAMTNGIDGLSDEKIEFVRQKKINEVYEVIEELKDKCDIRGFTLWSKTDSQNFRVHLANENLLRNGGVPITTLHGGMFTESMVPKSATYLKNKRKQNFNYHNHTSRCGHASEFEDRSYVFAARNMGIDKIGFSDHIPFTSLEYWNVNDRMHISDVDDYIASIRKLGRENLDMSIICGFEAEYSKEKEGFLCEIRDKCDYMILGQHYVTDGLKKYSTKSPDYPIKYAESVCKAMESGIFDIVAHPDIFMSYRDKMVSTEDSNLFMENARTASYMICRKAKKLGIPLEINAAGLAKGKLSDGEYSYPHSLFWEIAGEIGPLVLYGVDAHHPGQIINIDDDRSRIDEIIDISKLNLVSDDYDIVASRENNEKLQQLYEQCKSKSITYETALIRGLLSSCVVDGNNEISEQLSSFIGKMKERLTQEANAKKNKISEKITTIAANDSLSSQERVKLLAQAKFESENIKQTISERLAAFDRANVSIEEARELGCQTKDEYVSVVANLTEVKTQNNPSKVMEASRQIDSFKDGKKMNLSVENNSLSENRQKTYTYKTSNGSNGSSSQDGFTNSINLALTIWLLILIIVILGLIFT